MAAIALGAINLWLGSRGAPPTTMPVDPVASAADSERESTVRKLVSSEELILELTPLLRSLSRGILNLELPDARAGGLFAERVEVIGRLARTAETLESATGPVTHGWTVIDDARVLPRGDLALWQQLFAEVDYFENANFYFVNGSFAGTLHEFDSILGFDGLAKYRSGRYASLQAEMRVGWRRERLETGDSAWRIHSWRTSDFRTFESAGPLFADVLDSAVVDRNDLARARTSRHEQITKALLAGQDVDRPFDDKYPFFFPDVTLEHPGVAVVDIDGNGFDDLFVAMQHGPNLLMRNAGDGTFEEVAAEYGLTTRGDSTSAVFADFDNDGDPDLFLGRARHRSQYLVNDNGRFVDRSAEFVRQRLPYMVSSISAADYNGDGLLDVYFSTYSPIEEIHRFSSQTILWTQHFLSPWEAEHFRTLIKGSHSFLARPGPPNMLLVNAGGGKFELAPENEQLQLWTKSFQASWTDLDADGDPDLYVANDYAPDNFFRNDTPNGFTDVTSELGLVGMGFGMGVSWGDYDNDGRLDVYVSNMYSKAGQRITSRIAGIDPRFREMAAGNFLYRRAGDKFTLASGLQEPALQVAKAGWSWGGQFFDFNNDGFGDIYVASGFYTSPAEAPIDVDL